MFPLGFSFLELRSATKKGSLLQNWTSAILNEKLRSWRRECWIGKHDVEARGQPGEGGKTPGVWSLDHAVLRHNHLYYACVNPSSYSASHDCRWQCHSVRTDADDGRLAANAPYGGPLSVLRRHTDYLTGRPLSVVSDDYCMYGALTSLYDP